MFKFDPKNVENFANKIKDIMPKSLKTSREEMQKTLRSGAEGVIQKLDLVSREEFEILKKVVQRQDAVIKKLQSQKKTKKAKKP